jgi:hypothetical protein
MIAPGQNPTHPRRRQQVASALRPVFSSVCRSHEGGTRRFPRNDEPPYLLFVLLCVSASDANAQQAWQVTTTPHFECYFEAQSQDRINRLLFEAERAYARISLDMRHDLAQRVPLVFVGGDVATTAGLIQRVPLDHYLIVAAETDDQEAVLLHELTHQFELELMPSPFRVPPWVLEGLAEFERVRWMPSQPPARASVIVPISQLTTADRDGARAVLSFIADEFGTDGIRRLLAVLRDTAGDAAVDKAFGLNVDEFENRFEAYMKAY